MNHQAFPLSALNDSKSPPRPRAEEGFAVKCAW